MIIQANISAINAQKEASKMNKAAERLGSGYKLNRAADNAAGLTISEKMRSQIRGLDQAGANVQDGISLIQTAEGAMGDIGDIIHKIRELSVQASNDTYTDDDRECINQEVQNMLSEVNRIAEDTEFNTMKLLAGEWSRVTTGRSIPVVRDSFISSPGFWSADYSIDLSNVRDGAIVEIDGIKFEFNSDGGLDDPTATEVDIKGVSNIVRGQRFEQAIRSSSIDNGINYNNISILYNNTGPVLISFVKFGPPPSHAINSYPSPARSGRPLNIQLGPSTGDSLEMYIDQVTTDALGIDALKVTNRGFANNAITLAENALGWLSNARAALGAIQNRLEYAANHIGSYEENLTTTESKIRDADMAKEVADYHRSNVLVQSSHSMQAQSEKSVQGVLKLLE